MVNHAIGTVEQNLLEGALIVSLFLSRLLGNLRAGLIVASVIPLSMLFAVILLNAFGVSGNLIPGCAGFWFDRGWAVYYCGSGDAPTCTTAAICHQQPRSRRKQMNEGSGRSCRQDDELGGVWTDHPSLIVYLPILALVGIKNVQTDGTDGFVCPAGRFLFSR